MAEKLKYQRVVLKLSGEALAGDKGFGLDFAVIDRLTDEIRDVHRIGVSLGLVVGGGNIFRGTVASQQGMDRVSADYMGMLATVINALALQDMLEKKDIQTRVMTAIRMEELAEPYIRRRAQRHLEQNRVVLFAGGTGNPYFSTDTAAVLRALEIEAQVIIKATSVDGIYTADPKRHPDAKFIPELSFQDAIVRGLQVMDGNAFGLCKDSVKRELATIRGGKATTSLLDTVRVEAYGGQLLPLNQVGSVAAPEPRLLTVQAWDKSLVGAIEKAIRASDLGLNPQNDGTIIRIPLPPLTEERRKELVKVVHKLAEEGRVAVRHSRTEAIQKAKKTEHVSEDDKRHAEKEIQKLHDDAIKQIDALLKAKEQEIMEV